MVHSAEEILAALRMGVDHTFTIKVRQLEIVVRVLSISERVRIVNEVAAEMSTKKPMEQNVLTESSLLAIRTLELATTPEPDSKIAPTLPAALLNRMSNDEIIALYNAYRDGSDSLDPSMETISDEHLLRLVDAAKKKESTLIEWPRPYLVAAIRHLATHDASPMGNTSGGSSTPSQVAD